MKLVSVALAVVCCFARASAAQEMPAEATPDSPAEPEGMKGPFVTTFGAYLELGPEHINANIGGKERTWDQLVSRFGLFGDSPDPEFNFYFDVDLSLLFFALLEFGAGPGDPAFFRPGAQEESALVYSAGHIMNLRGGGVAEVIAGIRAGGHVDIDFLAIAQAAGPGPAGDQFFGAPYISVGGGPTLAYVPTRRLRIYASPFASAMFGSATEIFTGYAVGLPVDVLFSVVPGFLDIKAQLNFEQRTFLAAIYDDARIQPGTFRTASLTLGVMGGIGWMFGF